ncbi:hypothetical protein PIB30_098638, partial [Stylosanthes scabra]|nr:hypothetical protein [Stylosanthes scabra]
QTTKGDDKAIPYPKEEDAEGCMWIDVIEELIMEVQKEEAMKQARYDDLDDTNHGFVLQKIDDIVQKNEESVQQKNESMLQKNSEQ